MKLYIVLQLDDHIDCDIQVLLATEMKTLVKNDTYILWTKKISATLLIELLEEYKNFWGLFELEENKNFLPLHQLWNYNIKLKESKQPSKYAIYLLLNFKLEILRKYLDKNLRCSLIQKSQLPIDYPVLFALKLGRGLRICVNY